MIVLFKQFCNITFTYNQFGFTTTTHRMAKITPLNAELQKIAIEELGEVPSRISADLTALREWLQHQRHLRVREDDEFLIQYLRGCKYSPERAKEKLDLYFSLKSKYPEMMNVTDVDEPKFREIHRLGCFLALPKPLAGTGPRIVVFRFNYSTHKYNIDDIIRPGSAVHELMMVRDPYACICGLVYIMDMAQVSTSHLLQMTPNFCKKIISFMEKSMPLRIKSIYYINTPAIAQQFFKMVLPFFSEKLRERIHVMGHNLAELRKDIPSEYLPQDYDGALPSLDNLAAEDDKMWDANREFFQENAKYGADESLRPGKPLDIDGLFGVGGSFRKLIVD